MQKGARDKKSQKVILKNMASIVLIFPCFYCVLLSFSIINQYPKMSILAMHPQCADTIGGNYLGSFGQFADPEGVAINGTGAVYVVDSANNSVQIFDVAGNKIGQFGEQGNGTGQFNSPEGIAINASGSVFVTDTGNHRVEIFDASGNFLGFLGNASFYDPEGIAISPTGTIYVAERDSYTINVFSANATSIWRVWYHGTGRLLLSNNAHGNSVQSRW